MKTRWLALAVFVLFGCGRVETSRTVTPVVVVSNEASGEAAWKMVLEDPKCPGHVLTLTAGEHPVPAAMSCFARYKAGDTAASVVSFGHPSCIPGHIRTQRLDDCRLDDVASAWTGDDCQKH